MVGERDDIPAEGLPPHYAQIIDRGTPEQLKMALLGAIDHARKASLDAENRQLTADIANARVAELSREVEWLKSRTLRRRLRRGLARCLPAPMRSALAGIVRRNSKR